MAKRQCCCKEENPSIKHYVAIPCSEYEEKKFSELGIKQIFDQFNTVISGLTEPVVPYKVIGYNQDNFGLIITKDPNRKVKFMLRGAGGGAGINSYGGNGAYIDLNYIPYTNSSYDSLRFYIGPGGTGPKPGQNLEYSLPTGLLLGAPGYPLASWGGAASAFAFNPFNMSDGGDFVAGAGGGAGAPLNVNDISYGGDAGIEIGGAGSGPFGGGGASTLTNTGGDAGGPNAEAGFYRRGGKGNRPLNPPNSPILGVGGGGGGGYYGGGGGDIGDAGGGGSSTLADSINQQLIEIDDAQDGTELGPGSRCNPFFSKTFDPGLGANNIGRFLKTLGPEGTTFISAYNGCTSQAAYYFRTRWCPCTENQVDLSSDSTGNFPDGPRFICLDQIQYDSIIAQAANLPLPPSLIDDSGIQESRLSFVIGGERYILVQWTESTSDPRTDHYYCTLGCETSYINIGQPESVKWYIPTKNNFINFSDSRRFFSQFFETYNFSNLTSCCDIFIGERICTPANVNCLYSTNENGQPISGCFCGNQGTAPKYKSICRSLIPDKEGPFIAVDSQTESIYLCIPAFGWHRFGADDIVKQYNFYSAPNSSENLNINLGNSLIWIADATPEQVFDPDLIVDEYCTPQGLTSEYSFLPSNCGYFGSNSPPCICEIILVNPYFAADYYGYNAPLNFMPGGNICARDLYGLGSLSCNAPEDCVAEKVETINITDAHVYRACVPSCSGSGIYNCTSETCPPINCNSSSDCSGCDGLFSPLALFAGLKRIYKNVVNKTSNLYKVGKLILNPNTLEVTQINSDFGPSYIGIGGESDPCEGGVPVPTNCKDATFVSFKYNVARHTCPPSDFSEISCCTYCGCKKDCCKCYARADAGNHYLVQEHKSYTSSLCASIYPSTVTEIDPETNEPTEVDDIFKTNSLQINLNPCLFSSLATSTQKINRALGLVKLLNTTVNIGGHGSVNTQKFEICQTCIIFGGCTPGQVASAISKCLFPYVSATVLDSRGWLGPRLMSLSQCYNGTPESVPLLGGDGFGLKNAFVNGSGGVSLVYELSSTRVKVCAQVLLANFCSGLSSEAGCGKGGRQTFRAAAGVSLAEWAFGTRWAMQQSQDYCFGEDDNNGTYETISSSVCIMEQKIEESCCSIDTGCAHESCGGLTPVEYCEKCSKPGIVGGFCIDTGPLSCLAQGTPCPPSWGICEIKNTPQYTPPCTVRISSLSMS